MGQRANSGRHASLDDKKQRAAGRSERDTDVQAIRAGGREPEFEKGKTAGAFGKGKLANRKSPLTAGRTIEGVGRAHRRSKKA